MTKKFTIHYSLRTRDGLDAFGRFNIGTDEVSAFQLFDSLLGNNDVGEKDVLLIELFEWQNGLPSNIRIKSCTLEEIGYNSKLITREVFRIKHLKIV